MRYPHLINLLYAEGTRCLFSGAFFEKKKREISRLIDNSLCLTSIAGDIIKKKNDEIDKKIEVIRDGRRV